MIVEATSPPTVRREGYVSSKIRDTHLERIAIIYVRQSTAAQVLEHRESAEMQYNLQYRAAQLGWHPDRIMIIDCDQGQSGVTAETRSGFQRLLAEVSLRHVGAIFGIEMSRLARSNKDWHQLLELCAIFQTLLADNDGVYDPADYNDRLLLGLKGTMSEAELHIIHNRLELGRQNKAERGELFAQPPRGYIRSASGAMTLDPDEQVQATIRLCFAKFEELESGRAVLRWLLDNNVRLPARLHQGPYRGELRWNRANSGAVYTLLQHPIYAGAYCFGRTRLEPTGQGASHHRVTVPMEDWRVLKKDHLPGYISWDQYLANVKKLAANAFRSSTPGAPRNGKAILGSVVTCGQCQRRMSIVYCDRSNEGRYVCYAKGPGARCQSIQAREVDRLVAQQLLRALEPASIELSVATIRDTETERKRLDQHWKHRLERSQYEVDRAHRQYQVVDPENRLVGRELERNWEAALRQQQQLEEDRREIEALASCIPHLWQAETTTNEQRKAIVRQMVDNVSVNVRNDSDLVDVCIVWAGGFESRHELRRSVQRYNQMQDFDRLRDRLLDLRLSGISASAIADQLNREGFQTARGKQFRAVTVQLLMCRTDVTSDKEQLTHRELPADNRWSVPALVAEVNVPTTTLCHWCRRAWLQCSKAHSNRWVIWADSDELSRLRDLAAFIRPKNRGDYPTALTTPKPLPHKS